MSAMAIIRAGAPQGAVPHERFLLTAEAWSRLPAALAAEPGLALLALWAEPGLVHAAFLDEAAGTMLLASAPADTPRCPPRAPARSASSA